MERKIWQSASKIVFILIAVAVVAGMFIGKIDAKDFMVLASMAFTYYFTRDRGTYPQEEKGKTDMQAPA